MEGGHFLTPDADADPRMTELTLTSVTSGHRLKSDGKVPLLVGAVC
jgi:hypothetical protein